MWGNVLIRPLEANSSGGSVAIQRQVPFRGYVIVRLLLEPLIGAFPFSSIKGSKGFMSQDIRRLRLSTKERTKSVAQSRSCYLSSAYGRCVSVNHDSHMLLDTFRAATPRLQLYHQSKWFRRPCRSFNRFSRQFHWGHIH